MPRNKYPEQTVEKILSAAERLFAQKGYAIVLISSHGLVAAFVIK